jgi:hypothetical protein
MMLAVVPAAASEAPVLALEETEKGNVRRRLGDFSEQINNNLTYSRRPSLASSTRHRHGNDVR